MTKVEEDDFVPYRLSAVMQRRHQPISCTPSLQAWRLLFPTENDSSLNEEVKMLQTATPQYPL